MKTSIKNLIAAILTVITLTGTAFASNATNNNTVTTLSQIKNINKMVVSGNVEILLLQAPTESVKVYDSYYSKNALVQQEDGVLRISSFQKETLTVAVYVRNLSSIELKDNSTLKTYGKVSFLSLDVVLKDKASADINATTLSLYTSVNDNAQLTLAGKATDHIATLGSFAKLSMGQLAVESSSVRSIATVYTKVVKKAQPTLESIAAEDNFQDLAK